jgi:hypothetical protein
MFTFQRQARPSMKRWPSASISVAPSPFTKMFGDWWSSGW